MSKDYSSSYNNNQKVSSKNEQIVDYQGEFKYGRTSFFDGGLFHLIFLRLLGFLVTLLSIGILFPWTLCWIYGWKINHTVIEGHRMYFDGSPINLFGNWIKWLLLSIITLGIYFFWVQIKLEDWKVKNTTFRN